MKKCLVKPGKGSLPILRGNTMSNTVKAHPKEGTKGFWLERLPNDTSAHLLDDEKAMIAAVHKGVVAVREKMAAGASREWLETTLRQFLHQGLIERLKVIEAADAGDEIADAALRQVFAEMLDAGIEPPATLKAYGIRAALRGPVRRGQGRSAFDNWKRDIGIAVMVFLTMKQFGLSPTRNREQRRRRRPSACSIVAAALGQARISVDEKTVEGIHHSMAGQVTDFAKRQFPHIF
jgi:hypothetical protein